MKRRELTRQQAIKLWTQSASGAGVLAHRSGAHHSRRAHE